MPLRFSDIEVIGDLTRSSSIEWSGMTVDCSGFRSERRRRTVRTDKSERGCREEQRRGQQLEGDVRSRGGYFYF